MIDPVQVLREELARLLRQTSPLGMELVLAGGFGVLLRVDHAGSRGAVTLAPLPTARATRDLDLVMSADLIIDAAQTKRLRRVLDEIGYEPIASAQYYQFAKVVTTGEVELPVKIDLFAEEPDETAHAVRDERRIRPHGFSELHAHRAIEAVAITERPVEIPLADEIHVLTPNLFSFWLLKLFALRDRVESEDRDHARRHAYDLYALWASTDEEEWEDASVVSTRHREKPAVRQARGFALELFGTATSLGMLRLIEGMRQEGANPGPGLIERFATDLLELLPAVES